MIRLLLLGGLVLGSPVMAQNVYDCDWRASAQSIAEPWELHTKTFSNGATRLALLDTVEPAAGAFWLLVLSPPYSELGDRQCRVVGRNGIGFAGLDFAAMQTSYDPARGLTFVMPARILDDGEFQDIALVVTLNQSTGQITTETRR